ncbi:thiamine phosphate synthase [Microlunatus capsulatus]|uniref:Thiamine-phosphate synthase n=1 Tax=Microlunatus capsulatus TaxID=99117 RepID=A0ABS4Z6G7_9ACTN|nr:thiamine phosphate synthase [Microlunatus capsulatus]MBP2416636.1 thiamine-phosphate pyrophosphorylase [Microlunatus capsulatus]
MSRPALDLDLYLVTDSALCGPRGVVETVRRALPGGVTAVQVREPRATTRELCALSRELLAVLAGTGVPLLVNDRLDVALAVGAQGVHLGQSDLPAEDAHRVAPELLLGLSVSTPEQVAAAPDWLDYLGVGPVRATATKPEAAAPLGLAGTAALVAAARVPCVAIGGIGPANAAEVRSTGVAGIAVVSAVCAADDPAAAAAALRGRRA